MTKEGFIKLIVNAQNFDKEVEKWDKFGINLDEKPIAELAWQFFDIAVSEFFTVEGVDWINWWLFDRVSLRGNTNKAFDENWNVIPTDTLDDLWNLVKNYQK